MSENFNDTWIIPRLDRLPNHFVIFHAETNRTGINEPAKTLVKIIDRTNERQKSEDERGNNEYNLALGERRDYSVLKFLVAMGANPSQFSIISYEEERPAIIDSKDEPCFEKNRRVELVRH